MVESILSSYDQSLDVLPSYIKNVEYLGENAIEDFINEINSLNEAAINSGDQQPFSLTIEPEALEIIDDGGDSTTVDIVIRTAHISDVVDLAKKFRLGILPIGAQTSATKNFSTVNHLKEKLNGVIGLRIETVDTNFRNLDELQPEFLVRNLNSRSFYINKHEKTVTAGAGLTSDQINKLLSEASSNELRAQIMLDLTSKATATLGGILATGATGPSGVKPADIVKKLYVAEGRGIKTITDPKEIQNTIGLLGTTNAIIAAEMSYEMLPKDRADLLIPLKLTETNQTWVDAYSKLLLELMPYINGSNLGVIKGIEELDARMLKNRIKNGQADQITKEIMSSADNPEAIVQVIGYFKDACEDLFAEEGLYTSLTTHTHLDGDVTGFVEERGIKAAAELRESLPEEARAFARKANSISLSTDVNVEIELNVSPEELQKRFNAALTPYLEYEQAIEAIAEQYEDKDVIVQYYRYGHIAPWRMNLHRRVGIEADENSLLNEVHGLVKIAHSQLMESLMSLNEINGITAGYGEKGPLVGLSKGLVTGEKKASLKESFAQTNPIFSFRAPKALV